MLISVSIGIVWTLQTIIQSLIQIYQYKYIYIIMGGFKYAAYISKHISLGDYYPLTMNIKNKNNIYICVYI